MATPSGRQITLRAGGTEATVVAVGGGLRSFSVDGADVVDGYAEDEQSSGGRGQVLAPWPNRIRDGRWTWDGEEQQLPLSEPSKHNASHGLVRWLTWNIDDQTATTAVLSTPLNQQPGWPFPLHLTAAYSVAPGSLEVTLTARNDADRPAPVGLGMHPYFTVGTGLVDEAVLALAATSEIVVDERSLPIGEEPSTGWSGPIGDAVIDTCFGGLQRDPDGLARVTLSGPSRTVTVWQDETWPWVQVFTGDTLSPDRRRRGVAIEPLTCPADALRSGRDLVVLEPGETLSGRWGISASIQS